MKIILGIYLKVLGSIKEHKPVVPFTSLIAAGSTNEDVHQTPASLLYCLNTRTMPKPGVLGRFVLCADYKHLQHGVLPRRFNPQKAPSSVTFEKPGHLKQRQAQDVYKMATATTNRTLSILIQQIRSKQQNL